MDEHRDPQFSARVAAATDASTLRALLEHCPMGVSIVARNPFERLFANVRMLELLGLDRPDAPGVTTFADPRDYEAVFDRINAGEVIIGAEFLRQRPLDGRRWWSLLDAQPTVFEGRRAAIVWVYDISARKAAEANAAAASDEARARANSLALARDELEAFSYAISHELRAPLRAIDGYSALLQDDHAGGLDEQGRAYLARIRESTGKMGAMIEGLLRLAQVGRWLPERPRIDLGAMAGAILADMRALGSQHEVDVRIAPDLTASADPRLMQIALTNLISNAWKYSARASAPRIEIGVQPQGRGRVFYVRDNGTGFDMRHAGRLFGAFTRLHSEHEYPGTGVGLATVKRIIERHGGTVWAESAPGAGATFYFTLG